MKAATALLDHLAALTRGHARALVDDPLGILDAADLAGHGLPHPIFARANLQFRLAWEPVRHLPEPQLVIRQHDDVLLPDVQDAAGSAYLRLTPRALLSIVTGGETWPAWVDQEAAVVAEGYERIAKLRAACAGQPLDDRLAEELLLQAVCGLAIEQPGDPADHWLALSRHERQLRRLAQSRSRLASRLQGWLARQPVPLRWLKLDDPTAAVRLTWLVALLQPHLGDLLADLPRLYPGAHALTGEDVTAVARVAYRLERLAPELAASQRDEGEAVLAGPLREAVVRLTSLDAADGAARVIRREVRSGHLVLMALRSLLEAVASDQPPHELAIEAELAELAARAAQFSYGPAVRVHALLLRSLLRLDRNRARLQSLAEADDDEAVVQRLLRHCADGDPVHTDDDLAVVKAALTDHDLAAPGWAPRPDPGRQKSILAGLYHLASLSERWLQAAERRAGRALAAGPAPAASSAAAAFDQRLEPLLDERGRPRVSVVLVAGLSWAAWQHGAGSLHRAYDVEAEPLLAPWPAHGPLALRRGLAGMRWRGEAANWSWDELLRAYRPELGLRRGRPPRAFEALAAAGVALGADTSRDVCLVHCDLLAGGAAGLPATAYLARVATLFEALVDLARSGRRDELVVLLSVSGAVRCLDAPGDALPGESFGPRCLVAGDTVPDGTIVVDGEAHGWPDWRFLIAGGRGRLAPAAAEPTYADGGVSLAELMVPYAQLTPVPRGEATSLAVSDLMVPAWLTAGEPTELAVLATLTGGALADVATLRSPDCEPAEVHATLDLGEQRRLALRYVPHLPDGVAREDRTVTAVCQVGRRRLVRSALVTVRSPEPAPAPQPAMQGDAP